MSSSKIAAGLFGAGALAGGYYFSQFATPLKTTPLPKKLIISGAPASGKGTQCKFLVEEYGVKHISTGDALRAHRKRGTDLGKSAQGFMDRGELVPDALISDIMAAETQNGCESGWLLDGVPRTPAQVKALNDTGLVPDQVIFLNVPDNVLEERITGRMLDPVTGDIYHRTFSPPADPAVAARCITRKDDTKEALKKRLELFYKNRQAIIDGYPGKILEIDGNQKKPKVFEDIQKALRGN